MTIDIDAKLEAVAKIVEGRVVRDNPQIPICVKGSVIGFPATLQAIFHGWPFGVTYIVETRVVEDPNRPPDADVLNLTMYPRTGRGIFGFFTHIILFESKGLPVGDRHLESQFVFDYNDAGMAERFIKYPGVADTLRKLSQFSKFSELTVKSDAGVLLSEPKSFVSLDLDVCRETFRLIGELGQVLFDSF